MALEKIFLDTSLQKFREQKKLGDSTFIQLNDADFFFKPSPDCNNIAIIIKHLYGNMMSRWTNFLFEDGEKEWRNRDDEFEDVIYTTEDLISQWEKGWMLVFDALISLNEEDLLKPVFIRKQELTVCEAIIRQIDHYGYHIGQIVQIGHIIKGTEWQSLSIARGKSSLYMQMLSKK